MSNLNESHPAWNADFTLAQGIDHELALTSILFMCSRLDLEVILPRKQQAKHLKYHKVGIDFSKTREQVLALDVKIP